MNQLFNTVNYFEFQAFEALRGWKLSGVYRRKPELHPISYFLIETRSLPALTRSYPRHFTFYVARPAPLHSYFFLLTSYFSYRAWKQKAAEAFLRPAAFG